jgi:hypothetical protein
MALLSQYSVRATRHPCHRVAIPKLPQAKLPLVTLVKIWARCNGRINNYGTFERYSSTGDQTSSSPSSHSFATPRKTAYGNPCKRLSAIQRSDQKLWCFWADTPLRVTRYRRHRVVISVLPQGKQPMEKFECNPTVRSKVMALLSRY